MASSRENEDVGAVVETADMALRNESHASRNPPNAELLGQQADVDQREEQQQQQEEEEEEEEQLDGEEEESEEEESKLGLHKGLKSTNDSTKSNKDSQTLHPSASAEDGPSPNHAIFPHVRRTFTAPAEGSRRPRLETRTSTLLNNLTRHATGEQPLGVSRNPYSYTFDPLSSDSDLDTSDNSSDDDEDSVPRRKMSRKRKESSAASKKRASEDQKSKKTKTRANTAGTADSDETKKGFSFSKFAIKSDFIHTKGKVSKRDGRLKISINDTANRGYVAKALGQGIRNHLAVPAERGGHDRPRPSENDKTKQKVDKLSRTEDEEAKSIADSLTSKTTRPRLNVLIMVIGSRGDIQPFLKIGKILKEDHGHRVRIASHPTFRDFVEKDVGLEFFSVGGDPSELMAFMVKNPGLIPGVQTVVEGEIQRRRSSMAEMFDGFWRAAINTTDDEKDVANLKLMGNKSPFIADAIIANPPSMAHVHIAEKLGIPLHIMFTFPYSPTAQFPHPLANIKTRKSNVDPSYVNFMSYPLVEMMTWQGLGDIVNRFREKTLRLEPVSSLWAPGALYRMKVPYTYMWSPSLISKPEDWGPEIDIGGFVFLELASNFKPPKELTDFLNAGDPPIYIGFGSIVVDDADAFTDMIFKAVKLAGVRALVNKGWGGLGQDNKNTPDEIFMLDNTPHDWLFPQVKAVVHHGGAGTTAIGLKCGKPTMIVPFFGDQPFWGAMVASAKAGAHECIPYKRLTAERLAEGIKQCLTEEAQRNVQKIADSIEREGDGAANAVRSFHRSLPLAGKHNLRCSILTDRVAVWKLKSSSLRLSALAAEILHKKGKIKWGDLRLLRHYEWNDFDGPGDPITGSVGAVTSSLYDIGQNFGMVPVRIAKHMRKHEEHLQKKREKQKRRQQREQAKKSNIDAKAKEQESSKAQTNGESGTTTNGDRPDMERQDTTVTQSSILSAGPSEPLPLEVLEDIAWGFRGTGAALLTMPNNIHIAIAQGLHNAPRLYGDATVRKPIRITGMKSGFRAARREFGYGVYDGWTGLVAQPVGDWKDAETMSGKFLGLGTGFGKGVGGFVLKNTNAIVAPPAYLGKGLIKTIAKHSTSASSASTPGSKPFIRRAHIIQGQKDLAALRQRSSTATSTGLSSEPTQSDALAEAVERAKRAWKVYEDLWAAASAHSEAYGKFRLRREKRRWDANGALENAETAAAALRAAEQGKDLEALFARRRAEAKLAEQPRKSAMSDQPGYQDSEDVLPNGRVAIGSGGSLNEVEEEKGEKDDSEKYESEGLGNTKDEADAKIEDARNDKSYKDAGGPPKNATGIDITRDMHRMGSTGNVVAAAA